MKKQDKQLEKILFEIYDKGVKHQDCNLTECIENIKQVLRIHDVVGRIEQLQPNQINDKEHKKVMKALYPKDNSKRFRR